jgi:hypothetical protein
MITSRKSVIDKLTALWALNESGLGGFLHVFNTPFTGLIVGGISILMISLIAFYAEDKWQAIIKALVVVLIIKMAVSPYSPVGAYVAVGFQGITGAVLFSLFSWRGSTLIVLGVLTFLESAIQKLIILTVLYGTAFWEAIDIYGEWVQSKLQLITESSTSSILITIYLSVYGMAGILAGVFIKSIVNILSQKKHEDFYLKSLDTGKDTLRLKTKSRSKRKLIWIWLTTVAVLVIAFGLLSDALFGWQKAVYILLRSVLILMLWYLVIGPFILKLVQSYLSKKKSEYQEDIANAMDLLPYLTPIIRYSWRETTHLKGYTRFKFFVANSISNCIHFKL